MGLGDGGTLMDLLKQFIEAIFHSFFCQNTYNIFKGSNLYGRSASELLKNSNKIDGDSIDISDVKKSGTK